MHIINAVRSFGSKTKTWLDQFRLLPKKKQVVYIGGSVVLLSLCVFGITLFMWEKAYEYKHDYTQVYSLVSDRISKSAAINITLPDGAERSGAESRVTFIPEIKGQWITVAGKNTIAFKPNNILEIGSRYSVALTTANGLVGKDFTVADDPRILDVLPHADTEADENSRITISFNRPMVPITSLSTLEHMEIPVDISPATQGKWKWIGTRTLQFIPTTRLVRSTHYKLTVESGLISMDGVAIPSFTHTFITRPLRLEGTTQESLYFNQPFELRFNQAVDLEKSAAAISAISNTNGTAVAVDVEYGVIQQYGADEKKIEKVDRKVLHVYPKKDRFGRSHLWDFNTSYQISISKAYPLGGGDIHFDQQTTATAYVDDLIQEVTATASSTPLVDQYLFDPKGKAVISFYEDIDLDSTKIDAKGFTKAEYGVQCKRENDSDYSVVCEEIPNKKKVILSFNPAVFSKGEAFNINFKKLVNTEGLTLNKELLTIPFKIYPELKVYSVKDQGKLTHLTLCTNSPILEKNSKDFYTSFITDGYVVFSRWEGAYKETQSYEGSCNVGEYVSRLRYGLLPETNYRITLSLSDVFGQQTSQTLSFRTEASPELYRRFQSLQKIYNVTTPDKTKLTFATENFDSINVHVCQVSPESMIKYVQNQPDSTTAGSSLSCIASAVDTIALSKNLWVNNYFQLDLKKYFPDALGQYVISFSHPQYLNSNGTRIYERNYLSVTNLAVGEKKVNWTKYDTLEDTTKAVFMGAQPKGNLYWVSTAKTLQPVIGAEVSVYSNPGTYDSPSTVFAAKSLTDQTGIARFPLVQDAVSAVIKSANDSAIITSWADTLNYAGQLTVDEKSYVYTDRPIYRPGQEVFIKGIYRVGVDGSYSMIKDKPVKIDVRNSKGEVAFTKSIPISTYGTFNTSFTLPSDAPLGNYYIETLGGYSYFEVEEYVGSAFEATANTTKDEFTAGDTADISVLAKYYFGVPVSGGKLEYSVTAQNYYFDRYTDDYFNFGADWYNCYDCGYGDTFIKRGATTINTEGNARVQLPLDFKTLFKDKDRDSSKIIVFHGTVTNGEGKSVSFQKSFIVHRGDYYAGIKADPYFVGKNESVSVKIKTVDQSGIGSKAARLDLMVSKVGWNSYKRQEVDGGYYNRSERTLTEVFKKTISTSGNGDYTQSLKLAEPGEYQLSINGTDDHGNMIKGTGYLYVYGEGSVSVRETNNATLDITTDKKDVNVGDTAKVIIQSPYKNAKALITVDRGTVMAYEIVDVTNNVLEYRVPIKAGYAPNMFVSVLLLSPDPQVKFGQVAFSVNSSEKKLIIDTVTDKANYLPGEKVKLTVTTKDASGKGIPAEVSIAVADVSVLALAGNPRKNPLLFFYGDMPLTVTTAANTKNILTEVEIPKGTKGGDGGNAADLATKKRGVFKDTAFWQADVTTDANGVGYVSFTLPDNLTRWQIESLGITKDTRLGVSYKEVVARKDVMIVPLKPRFTAPGDEFFVGASIFNQTNETQKFNVSYLSSSLPTLADANTSIKLKSGETTTVYFKVKAPLGSQKGVHRFTLSARNETYNDTVEQEIPINENITPETFATGGVTKENSVSEYVLIPNNVLSDRGGLTTHVSATLASYLKEAVQYLVTYPYDSGEQLASTLGGIAQVRRALNVKNLSDSLAIDRIEWEGKTYTIDEVVPVALKKLYGSQNGNGGFSYYPNTNPDFSLTLHVLEALEDLKDAGYEVRTDVIANAASYIQSWMTEPEQTWYTYNTDTLVTGLYALSRAGVTSKALTSKLLASLTDAYLNEQASNITLNYLALLGNREGYGVTNKVFKILDNRLRIDARGAYMPLNERAISWQYYETVTKNTALYLKALTIANKSSENEDKLLRWLLAGKGVDGSWQSTNNASAVIDTLVTYMTKHKETNSEYTVDLSLGTEKLGTWTFNKKNILAIETLFAPISKFAKNKTQALTFSRANGNGSNLYFDIGFTYFLPADKIAPRDEGFTLDRRFYALNDTKLERPLQSARVGDMLRGRVTVITGEDRHQIALENFIPAGFELMNFNLQTEDQGLVQPKSISIESTRAPKLFAFKSLLANIFSFGDKDIIEDEESTLPVFDRFYPDFSEVRDDRQFAFKEYLPKGQYIFDYYIRAIVPGTFAHPPAVIKELYFPENFGRTAGEIFTIEK